MRRRRAVAGSRSAARARRPKTTSPRASTAVPSPVRAPKCCVHFVGLIIIATADSPSVTSSRRAGPAATPERSRPASMRARPADGQQGAEHRGPPADRALHVARGQEQGVALELLVPGEPATDPAAHPHGLGQRGRPLVGGHEQQGRRARRDEGGHQRGGPQHSPQVQVGARPQPAQQRDGRGEHRGGGHHPARRDRRRRPGHRQRRGQGQHPARGDGPLDGQEGQHRPDRHPWLRPQAQVQRHPPGAERERGHPRRPAQAPDPTQARQQQPRHQEPAQQPEQRRRQPHPRRRGRDRGPPVVRLVEPAERGLGGVEPAVDVADEAVVAAAADDAGDVAVVHGPRPDHPPHAQQRRHHGVDRAGAPPAARQQPHPGQGPVRRPEEGEQHARAP